MSWRWNGNEQSTGEAVTATAPRSSSRGGGGGAGRRSRSSSRTGGNSSSSMLSSPSCWRRFFGEINPFQPWFQVQDHVVQRQLDIPESFAPTGWDVVIWKLIITSLTIFTLVYGIFEAKTSSFYMAYLSNWGVVFCSLYLLMSCINTTLLSERTAQPPDKVGFRIACTWLLFETAAHVEVTIIVLFWALDYKPSSTRIRYLTIAVHSVVGVLVWLDGLFVNRIPVRFQHWLGFVLPVESLWIIWSVAQAFLEVGNPDRPHDNNPNTNDDAIYPFFSWKDKWLFCLSISLIALFGMGFISYLILWSMSIYRLPLGCCCRPRMDHRFYADPTFYEQEENKHGVNRPKIRDVEEGSIFARWMR